MCVCVILIYIEQLQNFCLLFKSDMSKMGYMSRRYLGRRGLSSKDIHMFGQNDPLFTPEFLYLAFRKYLIRKNITIILTTDNEQINFLNT